MAFTVIILIRRVTRVFIVFSLFLSFACQPDFELNGDYREELVVYCLLNPQDPVHYLRVTKSFLNTDREILDSALRNPDKSGFDEPLEVWVEKWNESGRIGQPIPLKPDTAIQVSEEVFAAGRNTLYSTRRTIDPGCLYRLFIFRPETGQTLTASCFTVATDKLDLDIDNTYSTVKLVSLDSVYFYETDMYFSFVEVSETDTLFRRIPIFKFIETNGAKLEGVAMTLSLNRPDMFIRIGHSIEVRPDVKRYARARPFDYRLVVGDEMLFDYQNSFIVSGQLYQTTQPITNIRGGKGIFTSAYRKSLGSLYMLDQWYGKLASKEETLHLNFQPVPWKERKTDE